MGDWTDLGTTTVCMLEGFVNICIICQTEDKGNKLQVFSIISTWFGIETQAQSTLTVLSPTWVNDW